ncbi:putative FAD/NAD(P)-binding domain superfamily [Helianthus annuus]|nr:putative FAD/NAD(P)-binding domain superfamily [Helianthus annuus]
MKQFVLDRINKMPQEAQDVVERTMFSNISCAKLKFRLPWNVLFGKQFVLALHPMTPDIGQGGCVALEDSVVPREAFFLRKRVKKMMNLRGLKGVWRYMGKKRDGGVCLISVAYCVGFMQESKGKLCNIKYIIIVIFNLLVI